MLTRKYRPKRFRDVIGQDIAKKALRALAKNPAESPKSVILQGDRGLGKTTLARLFAKALNCERFQRDFEICNKCENCKNFDSGFGGKYLEYDSVITGNIETIRSLRDIFNQYTNYYRVVTFDESQVISLKAQSALLKIIEEGPETTFFIFNTTEPEKLKDTIHSRSLVIDFDRVSDDVIKNYVSDLADKEGVSVDDDFLDKVAIRSGGIIRDAVMLLSSYSVIQDKNIIKLPVNDIKDFFVYLSEFDIEKAEQQVNKIMYNPLYLIKRSFFFVVKKIIESFTLNLKNDYEVIHKNLGKKRTMSLYKTLSSEWVINSFADDYLTYSMFLSVVKIFKEANKNE